MQKSLKRGMLSVLIANIINMFVSLLSGFILPKWLSIDSYAFIKTFQLYTTYVGILHLGYIDGVYLKYGGVNIESIDKHSLGMVLSTIRVFQFSMTILGIIVGLIANDSIILLFGVSILPLNMVEFFKLMYQAVGEFGLYSKILNMTTISCFVLNMICLFLFRTDNPYVYVWVVIGVFAVIWIILELYFYQRIKRYFGFKFFSFRELTSNIKNGILLTLGNFSSIILTGMDRWFVKAIFDNVAFAQYSFAVSMENFLNVAVTPVSVTMYNYFCRETDKSKIIRIRKCMCIFGALLISTAFPAKLVIELFLEKYEDSIQVMFYLFGSQLFFIVIKSVYINLYKARKEQSKYFVKLLCVIGIGFVFNVCCYLILRKKEAFAIGTMLSAMTWLLLCQIDYKDFKLSSREWCFLLIEGLSFVSCGILFGSILGFLFYITITLFLSIAILKDDFRYLLSLAFKGIKKKQSKSVGDS